MVRTLDKGIRANDAFGAGEDQQCFLSISLEPVWQSFGLSILDANHGRPNTRVIKVRTAAVGEEPSNVSTKGLALYVPGTDLDDAIKRNKFAPLLWMGPEFLFVTFAELVNSSLRSTKLPAPDKEQQQSRPILKVCRTKRCSYEGYVHLYWYFYRKSEHCAAWARARELTGPNLQAALYQRLKNELLRKGHDSLVLAWGP